MTGGVYDEITEIKESLDTGEAFTIGTKKGIE